MKLNNEDARIAKEILETNNYTCVICKGDMICTSVERGIAPLLKLIDNKVDLEGFCAADKVVGKSAAMLYKILKIDYVYANVISESAALFFENANIGYSYAQKVEAIRNRANDGFCPMEQAVIDIDDCDIALETLRNKLNQLKGI